MIIMTFHLKLVLVTLSLLSILISAINGSVKNNNGNNNDNVINKKVNNNNDNNRFQLLKISYNDIQDKSSRKNVIDILKSSLSRDGNDNNLLYYIIYLCYGNDLYSILNHYYNASSSSSSSSSL